jgi:hypothetical protein
MTLLAIPIQTLSLFVLLSLSPWSLHSASAEESRTRTPDGRLIVDLKGTRVGLPILATDASRSTMVSSVQLYFPGPHLDILSVKDLMTKPEEAALRIAESKSVTLVVWGATKDDWFYDLVDGVVRVRAVDLVFGADANCNSWKRTYRDSRTQSLDKSADIYGWISQGEVFIKFLDDGKRNESRYRAVNCDLFFGGCRMTVCRNNLTAAFKFNGWRKGDGFRRPIDVSIFDGAIRFATEKIDELLLDQKADLTYGADE